MKHIVPVADYSMHRRKRKNLNTETVMCCDACDRKIKAGELYFAGSSKDFEEKNPGVRLSEFHYCYICFDTLGHYVD